MNALNHSTPRQELFIQVAFGVAAVVIGVILGILIPGLNDPLLITAGVVAVIFALVTFTNIEFGLLVLVFMTYTRFSDVLVKFHNAPSIARPYIVLLVIAILFNWFLNARIARGWTRSAGLVLAYGVVVFASIFYATDVQLAFNAALNFLKDGIIAVIIVILIRDGSMFKGVIWTLLAAGLFVGTISAFQAVTGTYDNDFFGFGQVGFQNIVGETEGNRLSGSVGDPNYYAQTMLVLIPLAINRLKNEKHWLFRIIAGWALMVISLAVVFSYSRGAVVAIGIMAIFWMLHSPPKLSDVLVGVLAAVILVGFIPGSYVDRLSTIPDIFGGRNELAGEVSYRGRSSEVIAAGLMFLDHPIVGVGVENYPVFYQQYSRRIGLDPRLEQRQAHNLYLQIAAELGLAGLLVFGWLMWTVFRGMQTSWQQLKSAGFQEYHDLIFSFAVGMVGYMGAAMFIHGAYPRYFWLLVGIALAIPQVAKSLLNDTEKAFDGSPN